MDQTPITNKKTANGLQAKNKKTANGLQAKKRGRLESDPSDLNSPNELQDPSQALRAMRAGEKCLDAGASDYLAKAVNSEQLLSALRSWLHR
jgi:CheY-like chemotaxis protein